MFDGQTVLGNRGIMNKKRMFPQADRYCVRLLEEVRPNIYQTTYELSSFPFAPRVDMFCVVEPGERAMLIDTGWWEITGVGALNEMVRRFNVPWENVQVFLTHFHNDHAGNLDFCLENGAHLVMHGPDDPLTKEDYAQFLRKTGADLVGERGDELAALAAMAGRPDLTAHGSRDVPLTGSEHIDIAGYSFKPILTPGHAPEHVCLQEEREGILFAGDHIVEKVPLASQYKADSQVLLRYLEGLQTVGDMNLTEMYMSHCRSRRDEEIPTEVQRIIHFYERPLRKTLNLLIEASGEPLSIYELACRYYAYRKERIADLDSITRMRRLSGVFLFAEYLHDIGLVQRVEDVDGVLRYFA